MDSSTNSLVYQHFKSLHFC
uniref:Uncharacterized protein n=1 Tax=Anguilla anguilla TaxID=7936 RepID=A0A0E9QNH4_ANGAN